MKKTLERSSQIGKDSTERKKNCGGVGFIKLGPVDQAEFPGTCQNKVLLPSTCVLFLFLI